MIPVNLLKDIEQFQFCLTRFKCTFLTSINLKIQYPNDKENITFYCYMYKGKLKSTLLKNNPAIDDPIKPKPIIFNIT